MNESARELAGGTMGMLRKLLGSKCSQHACVNQAGQLDPVAAGH